MLYVGRTLEETAVIFDGEERPFDDLVQAGGRAATVSMSFTAAAARTFPSFPLDEEDGLARLPVIHEKDGDGKIFGRNRDSSSTTEKPLRRYHDNEDDRSLYYPESLGRRSTASSDIGIGVAC
jgi:hypothetical protein